MVLNSMETDASSADWTVVQKRNPAKDQRQVTPSASRSSLAHGPARQNRPQPASIMPCSPTDCRWLNSERFILFKYKVEQCPFQERHNFMACPYAHGQPSGQRRSPEAVEYAPVACPFLAAGSCSLGAKCPYSHNLLEKCFHPFYFCTMACNKGPACSHTPCCYHHQGSGLSLRQMSPQYCPTLQDLKAREALRDPADHRTAPPEAVRAAFHKASSFAWAREEQQQRQQRMGSALGAPPGWDSAPCPLGDGSGSTVQATVADPAAPVSPARPPQPPRVWVQSGGQLQQPPPPPKRPSPPKAAELVDRDHFPDLPSATGKQLPPPLPALPPLRKQSWADSCWDDDVDDEGEAQAEEQACWIDGIDEEEAEGEAYQQQQQQEEEVEEAGKAAAAASVAELEQQQEEAFSEEEEEEQEEEAVEDEVVEEEEEEEDKSSTKAEEVQAKQQQLKQRAEVAPAPASPPRCTYKPPRGVSCELPLSRPGSGGGSSSSRAYPPSTPSQASRAASATGDDPFHEDDATADASTSAHAATLLQPQGSSSSVASTVTGLAYASAAPPGYAYVHHHHQLPAASYAGQPLVYYASTAAPPAVHHLPGVGPVQLAYIAAPPGAQPAGWALPAGGHHPHHPLLAPALSGESAASADSGAAAAAAAAAAAYHQWAAHAVQLPLSSGLASVPLTALTAPGHRHLGGGACSDSSSSSAGGGGGGALSSGAGSTVSGYVSSGSPQYGHSTHASMCSLASAMSPGSAAAAGGAAAGSHGAQQQAWDGEDLGDLLDMLMPADGRQQQQRQAKQGGAKEEAAAAEKLQQQQQQQERCALRPQDSGSSAEEEEEEEEGAETDEGDAEPEAYAEQQQEEEEEEEEDWKEVEEVEEEEVKEVKNDTVCFTVQGLDGKSFGHVARASDTVSLATERIVARCKYQVEDRPLRLLTKGRLLDPAATLGSCGLDDACPVRVVAVYRGP